MKTLTRDREGEEGAGKSQSAESTYMMYVPYEAESCASSIGVLQSPCGATVFTVSKSSSQ